MSRLTLTAVFLVFLSGVSSLSAQNPPVVGSCTPAQPGQPARTLSGTVTDRSGASIRGAVVTVSCGDVSLDATTDADGAYRMTVPPGVYRLRVASAGFEPAERTVTVPPTADATAPVTLAVASLSDTVTVTAAGVIASRSASGTKTDTPLIETPQMINVITAQEIAARGQPITVAQALQYTPGVFVADSVDTRYDYGIRMRGFTAAGYVDGLFMQTGADRATAQFEPYGMERLETLKGPSSVMYGQNAPGGLVNRVSKRPQAARQHEFLLQRGSFGRMQGALDTTGTFDANGRLLYRVVGLVRRSDTQVDFVEDNRAFVAPSLTWQPRPSTSVTFLSHYQRDSGGEYATGYLPAAGTVDPSPFGRIPTGRFLGEPDYRNYDRSQYALGYAVEHAFSDRWLVRQNMRYLHVNVDYRNIVFPSIADDGRTALRTLYEFDENIAAPSVDTVIQGLFSSDRIEHRVLGGVDARWNHDDNVNGYHYNAAPPLDIFAPVYGAAIPNLPMNGEGHIDERQVGLYAQDQIRAGRWIVTLGGRHDWSTSNTDYGPSYQVFQDAKAFTGRAGVGYVLPGGWAPYASYSTSFEPTTGADFFGEAFVPTTGRQIEAGIKYEPRVVNGLLALSVFDLRQENIITTDPDPTHLCGGWSCSTQTGEARVRGIEVEGKVTVRPGLQVMAGYTFLNGKYTRSNDGYEGMTMMNVPRQQLTLWGDYGVSSGPLAGLALGGGLRHSGTVFGDTFNLWRNEPTTFADAVLRYSLSRFGQGLAGAQLAVNATNLTDKTTTYCANYGCTYGPRRAVVTTLTYAWR